MSRPPPIVHEATEALRSRYGASPTVRAWAPGRINVIGEHTDYNEGLALPGAIDRYCVVALHPRPEPGIRIWSLHYRAEMAADTGPMLPRGATWQRYVSGCINVYREHVGPLPGFDAVFGGNVPIGAGLSSSAALEVAWINALRGLTGHPLDGPQVVSLCQRVEHEHLDIPSGTLDQSASQYGRADRLVLLDFAAETHRRVRADLNGYRWVVLDTGVRRALADSAYARRVRECQEGFNHLRTHHPDLQRMGDLTEAHLHGLSPDPEPAWLPRLRHVVSENTRVRETVGALRRGDLTRVGALLLASHESLKHDYAVSCPELDLLVDEARRVNGCLGARMMGGGFGGCTLNLVHGDAVEPFSHQVDQTYHHHTGKNAPATPCTLVDGATVQRLPPAGRWQTLDAG